MLCQCQKPYNNFNISPTFFLPYSKKSYTNHVRATQLSYPAGVEPAHTKNVETRRAHILWVAPKMKMTQKKSWLNFILCFIKLWKKRNRNLVLFWKVWFWRFSGGGNRSTRRKPPTLEWGETATNPLFITWSNPEMGYKLREKQCARIHCATPTPLKYIHLG